MPEYSGKSRIFSSLVQQKGEPVVSLYFIIMSRTSLRVIPHSVVCLNIKKHVAWSRHRIWGLSDSNEIRTHNHLVRTRTLKHFAKLAKWLSCVVSTYLYGPFGCILLSCHVGVPEWIHTLYFAWMSRNSLLEVGTISKV